MFPSMSFPIADYLQQYRISQCRIRIECPRLRSIIISQIVLATFKTISLRESMYLLIIMTFVNRINVDYVFLTEEAKNSLMAFALKYAKETHVDWNTILMQILRIIKRQGERKVVLEEFRRYCLFWFVFVDILKVRSSKFPCSLNTREGVAVICIGILTSPIQQSQY